MYLSLFLTLAVLTMAAVFVLRSYNAMRLHMENLKESLSNISVVTSKKISLVNQLITIVQSYQESEKFVMLQVSSDTVQGMQEASTRSGTVIADIGRMAQKFPELKSNQQYGRLMDALQIAEQEVQNTRLTYNRTAKIFNTARTSVPTIFYATSLGFGEAQYLSIGTAEDPAMKVQRTMQSGDASRLNDLLERGVNRSASQQTHSAQLQHSAQETATSPLQTSPALQAPSKAVESIRFCPQCGVRNDAGGSFCGDCGTKF